jgi:hypothetical protein
VQHDRVCRSAFGLSKNAPVMNDQLRTDLQKINDRLQTLQVRL